MPRTFIYASMLLVAGVHLLAQKPCADADAALAASHWVDAEQAYRVCLVTQPSAAVYSNLGMTLAHQGRLGDAIATYTEALKLEPGNDHIRFNLAIALLRAEEYNTAADHLSQLARHGSDPRADELLAFAYYHLGSYALAARAAEHVRAKEPDDAANNLILGSAYTRLHRYQEALPLITAALGAAGSAEAHLILAQTLIGLRHYGPAQAELAALAQQHPDSPGLHEAQGEVLVGTEHPDAAKAEFLLALGDDPEDFQSNYFLGRLNRFQGDLATAKQYIAKAAQLRPHSPDVAFEQAEIAVKEGRFADAVPLLEATIAGEPEEAQAYLQLANAYARTGRKQDAQREGELYESKRREAQKLHETERARDATFQP